MSIGIRKFNMKKLGKLLVPLQPYIEDNISLFYSIFKDIDYYLMYIFIISCPLKYYTFKIIREIFVKIFQ